MTHYLHVFSTFDPGGPQVRTAQIMARLPADHRHTVVAMDGRTGCLARLPDGVRVDLEPAPRGRGLRAVSAAVAALLRRLRPDLLVTYNWGAIESLAGAWRAGFERVVHHEEGFGSEEMQRLLWRRNLLRRLLLPRARAVLVPSRNLERIARTAWRQPASRVLYLPNGVDLERFRPAPRAAGGDIVIGNVATFRPVKNQALLLRAFAAMRQRGQARLLLVGDGPDLGAAAALAAELGIAERVELAGSSDDTAADYGRMDVYAMSSRTEQMPIVVLEAMACGLPVASTDVGDVRTMVSEDNERYVVPRDNPVALARALDELVADADLRARLGAANRARCAREFESEACLGRYADVFARVARGRSAAG